jgi:hypothetical protein
VTTRKPGEPGLAWHYTDANGLLSIVASGKLRASSAAYMNDPGEMEFGQRLLSEHFKLRLPDLKEWQVEQLKFAGIDRRSSPHSSFLLSAAQDGDLLTLWRYYGVESVSYSIGLDTTASLMPIATRPGDTHPNPSPTYQRDAHTDLGDGDWDYVDPDHAFAYGGRWKEVKYVLSPTDEPIQAEFDKTLAMLKEPEPGSRRVPFILLDLGVSPTNYWKDAGFVDEREIRATWWVQPNWKYVAFRPGRFGLIPYIDVAESQQGEAIDFGATTRLPIREITIGPTPVARQAKYALESLLDTHGYHGVQIRQSVTPFR